MNVKQITACIAPPLFLLPSCQHHKIPLRVGWQTHRFFNATPSLRLNSLAPVQIKTLKWTRNTQVPLVPHSPMQQTVLANRRKHFKPLPNFSFSNLQNYFLISPLKWETQQPAPRYKISTQTTLTSISSKVPANKQITAKLWCSATEKGCYWK